MRQYNLQTSIGIGKPNMSNSIGIGKGNNGTLHQGERGRIHIYARHSSISVNMPNLTLFYALLLATCLLLRSNLCAKLIEMVESNNKSNGLSLSN